MSCSMIVLKVTATGAVVPDYPHVSGNPLMGTERLRFLTHTNMAAVFLVLGEGEGNR